MAEGQRDGDVWSAEEYAVLNAKMGSQLKDRNLKFYLDLYVVSRPL